MFSSAATGKSSLLSSQRFPVSPPLSQLKFGRGGLPRSNDSGPALLLITIWHLNSGTSRGGGGCKLRMPQTAPPFRYGPREASSPWPPRRG